MSMTSYPHCKNQRRAACAKAALAVYQRAQNGSHSCEAEPTIELLIDILTDMRHWAAYVQFDFHEAVRISHTHFMQETRTQN